MKVDLKGKVAVVTGGGGVLCSRFAVALALAGAKVAVLNRTLAKAQKVVDEIKERAARLPQCMWMLWTRRA